MRMTAKRGVMAEAQNLCAYLFAMARNGAAEYHRNRAPDESTGEAPDMRLIAIARPENADILSIHRGDLFLTRTDCRG